MPNINDHSFINTKAVIAVEVVSKLRIAFKDKAQDAVSVVCNT